MIAWTHFYKSTGRPRKSVEADTLVGCCRPGPVSLTLVAEIGPGYPQTNGYLRIEMTPTEARDVAQRLVEYAEVCEMEIKS